jgi:putative exosortase-associated protein (TIGR04073 family)
LTCILTSPVEYYSQYVKVAHQPDPFVPVFEALMYGTAATLQRIVIGAYEVVTFPVPVPADYAPVIRPATPLDGLSQMEK